MAKRFTDTGKWDKAWFRRLTPKLKCAWEFLRDRCDHAGIWDADFDSMEHFIGERVTAEELEMALGDRIKPLSDAKYFIPPFVEFQYGELNPANKVHKSVLKRLEKVGVSKPLGSPSEGAKDKEKDKEKDKDQEEFSAGAHRETAPLKNSPPPLPVTGEDLARAKTEWLETLAKFGAGRKNLLPEEELLLARSIQRWGVVAVVMAIQGKRREKRDEKSGYDPAQNLALQYVLNHQDPGKFNRLMNLGVQGHNKAAS